jgi:tetratricopeptide (TPR) repeat protein
MQSRIAPVQALVAATALFISSINLHAAESAEDLVKKGDVCDVKLQAAAALEIYQRAEKLKPNDPCILCRIARQYRHLMADAASPSEKLRLGGIALTYGDRAAALAPTDSEAQLSSAISYGKMIPFQGKKEQVTASYRIREAAEKAVRLDPQNDLAWHVLGRWHRVVTDIGSAKRALASIFYQKLPASSNEDAVNCLQKAIAINPNRPMHYIELGRTYVQMGKTADARRFFEKGLALPNEDKDDPELKALARTTLAELR